MISYIAYPSELLATSFSLCNISVISFFLFYLLFTFYLFILYLIDNVDVVVPTLYDIGRLRHVGEGQEPRPGGGGEL